MKQKNCTPPRYAFSAVLLVACVVYFLPPALTTPTLNYVHAAPPTNAEVADTAHAPPDRIGVEAWLNKGLLLVRQLVARANNTENNNAAITKDLDLFRDIFERIRSEYVEKVDDKELIRSAIDGMLSDLDPHSSYLSNEDLQKMHVQTRGQFGGLGIEITKEDGFIKVVAPIDDTPAARVGIQSGDLITHINGKSTFGMTLNESVDLMRGKVGSDIVITILRKNQDDPFDVKITRDTIKLIAAKVRAEGNVIIARITTFNNQTMANLETNLKQTITDLGGLDNVDGLVLDLRNNPGGLLSQSIRVADAFLDDGVIVSTRSRHSNDDRGYTASQGDLMVGKPIVVLINSGSASASEIVAGALQDHQRALVIGTRSFGKGSVQTVFPLDDNNGGMRLTTARYYTPSGRSIQALGIAPDILVEQPASVSSTPPTDDEKPKTESNFAPEFETDLDGRLDNDSILPADREKLEQEQKAKVRIAELRQQDYQLAYALDIVRGLAVLEQSVSKANGDT